MNQIQVFRNSAFGELGILTEGEKVFFPATESAKMLGYSDPYDAIKRHTKGSVKRRVLTEGGEQEANFIPEGDLYRLIVRSQLPAAEQFEKWVFDEVLPSIRQTGNYSIKPITPTEALLQAVQILDNQAKQIAALEDKVTTVNHRIDSLDTINITGTPQQRLNAMVRKYSYDKGILYPRGWEDFKVAFNYAYRTNLETRRLNYMAQHNLKRLSIPQYLTNSGLIEDALRVADKMLNKVS